MILEAWKTEILEAYSRYDNLKKIEEEASIWNDFSQDSNLKNETLEKQYQSFDILAPDVIIPADETTYWCSAHKIPDFVNTAHGVGFESLISNENQDVIHHMEVTQMQLTFFQKKERKNKKQKRKKESVIIRACKNQCSQFFSGSCNIIKRISRLVLGAQESVLINFMSQNKVKFLIRSNCLLSKIP